MPLYTYACPSCGFESEEVVKFEEIASAKVECQKCHSAMVRAIDAPKIGKPRHQNRAILGNGRTLAGEFGKTARNK
jgi:putative FmdB family regulatory protein